MPVLAGPGITAGTYATFWVTAGTQGGWGTCTQTGGSIAYGYVTPGTVTTVPLAPDLRAQWEQQQAEQLAQWEQQQAERLAREQREREDAAARAAETLAGLLTPQQARDYAGRGWFEVRGSRGRRWRIRNEGQQGNVDLMPETGEMPEAVYCAHPPGGLPAADAHLAQMLALVTDEDAFLAAANLQYRHRA